MAAYKRYLLLPLSKLADAEAEWEEEDEDELEGAEEEEGR